MDKRKIQQLEAVGEPSTIQGQQQSTLKTTSNQKCYNRELRLKMCFVLFSSVVCNFTFILSFFYSSSDRIS